MSGSASKMGARKAAAGWMSSRGCVRPRFLFLIFLIEREEGQR